MLSRRSYLLLPLVTVHILTGCGGEDAIPGLSNSVAHPLDESRLEPERRRNEIVDAPQNSTVFSLVSEGPNGYPPLRASGGPVLGLVADMAVDPESGSVIVLDGQANQVIAFHQSGDTTLVGRPGRGPGEYLAARALDINENGDVLVADEALGMMTFRTMTGGNERFVYQSGISMDVVPSDMCVLGDSRIAVLGVSLDGASETLHLIDPNGSRVWSSLVPYATDNQLLRMYMSEGKLACAADGIFVAFSRLGEVMRVDLDGTLVWMSRITDYRPVMTLTLQDDRQSVVTGIYSDSDGVHRISGMHLADSTSLLLQVESIGADEGGQVSYGFLSYLIRSDDGSGNRISDMPDRRIAHLGDGIGLWFDAWRSDLDFFEYEISVNSGGG